MKAMILAAGLGTRLRPLTDVTPKPLLPVGGTPLIVWNLLLLRRHGIRDVIINIHHLGSQIEQALGDGRDYGLRVVYSREPIILGTGGGIKQAEWFFGGTSFLVVNGDTVFELDLRTVIDAHEQSGALATMVLRDDPEADAWGAVEVDAFQHVQRINGRGAAGPAPTVKRMFAGIHVLQPKVLCDVPVGRESSIIEAYTRELQRGATIHSVLMTGYWSDVGTPERYAQVQDDIAAGRISFRDRAPDGLKGRE